MTTLLTFTPWPAVSAAILLILLVAALYFARDTAHQAIQAAASALAQGLRVASHSVAHAQAHLAARNREEAGNRVLDVSQVAARLSGAIPTEA